MIVTIILLNIIPTVLFLFYYYLGILIHGLYSVFNPIQQNMIKSTKATEKQQSLVKVLEQEKKTLEHEINAYRQKAQQERKIIQQLEKERDRYINENSSLIQKAGSAGKLDKNSNLKFLVVTMQAPSFLRLRQAVLPSTGATEDE